MELQGLVPCVLVPCVLVPHMPHAVVRGERQLCTELAVQAAAAALVAHWVVELPAQPDLPQLQ